MFAQPLYLWALLLIPLLLAFFVHNERRRGRVVEQMVARRLRPLLAGSSSPTRRWIRFALLVLGFAAAMVAAAQPRWGYAVQERKIAGRDILIAIDISRSMLANDISPNRLERAKLAAADLIQMVRGELVGLIAFAGEAYLQAPLTGDHAAVLEMLREFDTELIALGGTNIAAALREAKTAFGKGESDERALIIISDGEELSEQALKEAAEFKGSARIFTVGIGSPGGTIISVPNEEGKMEYVKDSEGKIVKSRLDEEKLRAIAQATGGFYVHMTQGLPEMKQIVQFGLEPMSRKESGAEETRQPIERYQWPLGMAIACLTAFFAIGERRRITMRRGVAAAASVAIWLLAAPTGEAASGFGAFLQKKYGEARDLFAKRVEKDPDSAVNQYNLGAAAYKVEQYDEALDAFSKAITTPDKSLRAKAEYNLGNTLFKRGGRQRENEAKLQEWEDALKHYDEALRTQPGMKNAEHNRKLVQGMVDKLKKEQEEQKKKEEQQQQQQQKQKGEKGEKEKGQSQQEGSEGESSDDGQEAEEGEGGQKMEGSDGDSKEGGATAKKGSKIDPGAKPEGQKADGEKADPQKDGDSSTAQKKQGDGGEQDQSTTQQPPQGPGEPIQDRKLTGEMKTDGTPEGEKAEQEAIAAEEAQAAAEGRMTDRQARALLESLRGDDRRVQLEQMTKERKANERFIRDW